MTTAIESQSTLVEFGNMGSCVALPQAKIIFSFGPVQRANILTVVTGESNATARVVAKSPKTGRG
jgi:hypothetical protein